MPRNGRAFRATWPGCRSDRAAPAVIVASRNVTMIVVRALFAVLLASSAVFAQESFTYTCTPDDVADFGLTCSEEEPCQVFLEVTEVEAVSSTLVVTGNLHTATTTLWGILLVSEDGGKTWTEPAKRIKS